MTINWIKKTCLFCEDDCDVTIKFRQNFLPENLNSNIFSARRTTEHYHYQILECKKTGLVFSSPILPYDEIEKLYKESKQTYDSEVKFIASSYISYIKQNLSLFDRKDKALEIGCGSGFFLRELQKVGFKEVYGVEPSSEAVSKSGDLKPGIFTGFFENAKYSSDTFDLIACFQTLDHIINPLEALNKTYQLLKPEGIAYFIVHNEKSLQAKIFGEKSPIYDVEHIYLFNKTTLPKLFNKAGFETIGVFDVKNTYPLSYWLRMSPIPFKNFFNKLAKHAGLSDKTISIKAGNIGIFARK